MQVQLTIIPDLKTGGTAIGVMLLITFFISIFAIAQRNHVTMGLVLLNWVLIADAIAVLVVGTIIWFYSLRQRNEYHAKFQAVSSQTRIEIQNQVRKHRATHQSAELIGLDVSQFSCCGYFLTNDTAEVGGFCANSTFINLNTTTACVGPITGFTDFTLNNVFT